MSRFPVVLVGCLLVPFIVSVPPAHAQLSTQHIKGTTGLKAGSMPPPHTYIPILYYVYKTDKIKDVNGNTLLDNVKLTSHVYGTGVYVVTPKKILGGDYAYQLLFPVGANNRIQG